jgi:vitamin B12 transporter
MNHTFAKTAVASWLLAVCCVAAANDMETITVTASRTPTPVDDAGSAISLITKQDIERQNAVTLADLLRGVPGLAVSRQGGIGTLAQIRVRGAEANQVLVLIDGIEANDIAQGSEFNFAQVLAGDVQRVEIVRGPQSALWGADALAGVINVITDPGKNASDRVRIVAETGSHNTVKSALDFNASGEAGSFSFGVSRFDTTGTNISRAGSEKDGYRNMAGHLSAHTGLFSAGQLTLQLRATNSTTDFDGIDFSRTGLPVDAPFVTDTRQRYGRVAFDMQLSDRARQVISLTHVATHNVNRTDAYMNDTTRGIKDGIHFQTNIAMGESIISIIAEHEADEYRQRGAPGPTASRQSCAMRAPSSTCQRASAMTTIPNSTMPTPGALPACGM